MLNAKEFLGILSQHLKELAVVPNRGGIPLQGGISWIQGRNFTL